jgi:hypothetical protein
MSRFNEPIDHIHAMSISATRVVRQHYHDARKRLSLPPIDLPNSMADAYCIEDTTEEENNAQADR